MSVQKSKIIFVVLDGLGDRPLPALGNKTPLEAAHTPHLDSLASQGIAGLVTILPEGIAPESDQGMLALLGYDVFKHYTGRGVLEAYGYGVPFNRGDVIMRVNFATAEQDTITDIQGGKLADDEAVALAQALAPLTEVSGVKARFVRTKGYRGVLILSGTALSSDVSNTHPGYRIVRGNVSTSLPVQGKVLKKIRCEPLGRTAAAKRTADAVNAYVEQAESLLAAHPVNKERLRKEMPQANTLLMRSASSALPKLRKVKGRWLLLADMPVESAIGKLAGMDVMKTPENLADAAMAVGASFGKYDSFYVHIKETDTHAHRGDADAKKRALERIDAEFFGTLAEHINLADAVVVVTGDHATPCNLRAHAADPVPVLFCGKGVRANGVPAFNESACRGGIRMAGHDVMKKALELAAGISKP
ncbi:MAG: 2,3-bisphosphoglycerate-independent phosphoglycerate mutase [Candidatus Aenigmarchaeota archaeon]|nr:2,3-bisphosphoglycerate-independent phosphoglycerate mutase [Candidatus Aenigmarchaeota archaeon]